MSFELDLPRELDSAAKARQAIDQLVGRLAEEQLGDVRLLVSELVTNSLRHGGLSAQDRIRLGVLVSAELVRVEVTDPGTGFAFQARPTIRTPSRAGGCTSWRRSPIAGASSATGRPARTASGSSSTARPNCRGRAKPPSRASSARPACVRPAS